MTSAYYDGKTFTQEASQSSALFNDCAEEQLYAIAQFPNSMPSIVGKIKQLPALLQRRSSDTPQHSHDQTSPNSLKPSAQRSRSKVSLSSRHKKPASLADTVSEHPLPHSIPLPSSSALLETSSKSIVQPAQESPPTPPISAHSGEKEEVENPVLTLEKATPEDDIPPVAPSVETSNAGDNPITSVTVLENSSNHLAHKQPPTPVSLQTTSAGEEDYFGTRATMPAQASVVRRIWVKRQGASATLIQISEDDLVDDAREKILRKYANSLGRTFDTPDVTLRIVPRPDSHGLMERSLGPEESVAATLHHYYPNGQAITDALIIDIPHRRTPRQSPRIYMDHHTRPSENGGDYFSVMPLPVTYSPHLNSATTVPTIQQPPHSISILNTGQLPPVPLPSPGASNNASRRHVMHRPRPGRTTTSSPTVLTTNGIHAAQHTDRVPSTPGIQPLPTPPINIAAPTQAVTPPPRTASPRPAKTVKPKKPKKTATGTLTGGMLDGGVPPISVLIVEDNIINLKLLEAFMKRLKVRWQTAMNGRDAVVKWRTGGFHLVLMDIQLPIMSGLEATREIRRLEHVNGIGVLSAKVGDTLGTASDSAQPEHNDRLPNMEQFKSPVIIVALTASSLQSDRHEALAAGCNDFLTKPVNFVWLERKVMEWGCMQALIDFDGWRKWKEFSQPTTITTKSARGTTGAAAANATATSKSKRAVTESHSDSTGDTETPPSTRPAIPDTLVALKDRVESGNTIDSLDSVESNDSVDTIDLEDTRRKSPLIPTLTTFSSTSSGSVNTTVPTRATVSRSSSAQSTATLTGGNYPRSPVRAAANSSDVYADNRRRKRSSLGRSGLSGVVEELEGVGAL